MELNSCSIMNGPDRVDLLGPAGGGSPDPPGLRACNRRVS